MPIDPDPTIGGVVPSNPDANIRAYADRVWILDGFSDRSRVYSGSSGELHQRSLHATLHCEFLASDFMNITHLTATTNFNSDEICTVAAGNGDLRTFSLSSDWRVEELDYDFNGPVCRLTIQLLLKAEVQATNLDDL